MLFFIVGSGGGVSIPPRGGSGGGALTIAPRLPASRGSSQEDERWGREASMRQPAGERETTAAAAAAAATVMATGNSAPPLSRDLATTITTTPASNHCSEGSWRCE